MFKPNDRNKNLAIPFFKQVEKFKKDHGSFYLRRLSLFTKINDINIFKIIQV